MAMFLRRILFYFASSAIMFVLTAVLAITTMTSYYTPVPDVAVTPFPVGIDIANSSIIEQPTVDSFYEEYLAEEEAAPRKLVSRLANELQTVAMLQNLASPVSRRLVVWAGERTEEVTKNIGDVLRWTDVERKTFEDTLRASATLPVTEGLILPDMYLTHRNATPQDIVIMLNDTFTQNVIARYPDTVAAQLPLSDVLIIASLLEREASDFENMRQVSGVIWNRLFIDMPLQLDATLQYARANNPHEPEWWPQVRSADKYIDSPYNTYEHTGLPPGPIANPSVSAIVAALNPVQTDCLFYIHGPTRDYYCSATYEEHKQLIQEVYGN